MKIQLTMMNQADFALDDKTNELIGVVRFQTNLPIDSFLELMRKVKEQKDGTFEVTI